VLGLSRTQYVYNAQNTDQSNWPWMATLGYWEDTVWVHTCGATLISEYHVLTAAHCLKDKDKLDR